MGDFALWKAWDEEDGDGRWERHGGRAGRDGISSAAPWRRRSWVREIDIHCGGEDNIFPHHEAEIAQTECVNRRKVRAILDALQSISGERPQDVEDPRNIFSRLRDLLEKGWTGREIRFALLAVKYASR